MATTPIALKPMPYAYKYERPALTVDCVVFGLDLAAEQLNVLLIERDAKPFAREWALPGGFVRSGESPDAAAIRELKEETGIDNVYLEQLYTFGAPDRDPRGWIVSVAHYALVSPDSHAPPSASSDARQAAWFAVTKLPRLLAFDHKDILDMALARLRSKVTYAPIGFELLPKKFSLKQLQKLYDVILGRELDNRNFRKKILGMGVLQETAEWQRGVAHRAARLYKFDERRYQQLVKQGWNFEI